MKNKYKMYMKHKYKKFSNQGTSSSPRKSAKAGLLGLVTQNRSKRGALAKLRQQKSRCAVLAHRRGRALPHVTIGGADITSRRIHNYLPDICTHLQKGNYVLVTTNIIDDREGKNATIAHSILLVKGEQIKKSPNFRYFAPSAEKDIDNNDLVMIESNAGNFMGWNKIEEPLTPDFAAKHSLGVSNHNEWVNMMVRIKNDCKPPFSNIKIFGKDFMNKIYKQLDKNVQELNEGTGACGAFAQAAANFFNSSVEDEDEIVIYQSRSKGLLVIDSNGIIRWKKR